MVNGHAIGHGGLHVHAGRLGVRVRVQLLQPQHGRRRRARSGSWRRPGSATCWSRRRSNAAGRGATASTTSRSASAGRVVAELVGRSREIRGTLFDGRPGDAMTEGDGRRCRDDVDELRALQLDRLRETLRRVYEHVPHYRRAFDDAGVAPDDLRVARRPGPVPVHRQGGPAAELPVRHVRRAPRARSAGCTPRPARPASRPSSATPPRTSTPGPR